MTQNDSILSYLESGKAITPMEAWQMFGCFRLSARIKDLRNKGYEIKTKIVKHNKKAFAKYYIETRKELFA